MIRYGVPELGRIDSPAQIRPLNRVLSVGGAGRSFHAQRGAVWTIPKQARGKQVEEFVQAIRPDFRSTACGQAPLRRPAVGCRRTRSRISGRRKS